MEMTEFFKCVYYIRMDQGVSGGVMRDHFLNMEAQKMVGLIVNPQLAEMAMQMILAEIALQRGLRDNGHLVLRAYGASDKKLRKLHKERDALFDQYEVMRRLMAADDKTIIYKPIPVRVVTG